MRPEALNQIVWKREASRAPCALFPPHPFRWVLHDPQLGAKNYPDRWVIVVVGAKPAVGWKYARSWLEELGSYGSMVSLAKPADGWK